jgi:phosphohistidine phosphatase
MSKQLILMRHAQAENPVGKEDHERTLTPEGERDARHMGRWLNTRFDNLDVIVTSTAFRAKQTAEIIAEEFRQNNITKFNADLYEASVRSMLEIIQGFQEDWKAVLLVGHNPTISYVSDYLISDPIEGMSPGTAVCLEFNETWNKVDQGSGSFVFVQSPTSI